MKYKRNATYEGSRAESWFRNECIKRNMIPCKPDNDLGKFDFVVFSKGKLKTVQIKKPTYYPKSDLFSCVNYHYKNGTSYNQYEGVDLMGLVILAEDTAHHINEDSIYLIPTGAVKKFKSICVMPHRSPKRKKAMANFLEQYRNAWPLLKKGE